MIKVYGSHMCGDSEELQKCFNEHEIKYQFLDITDNLRNLGRFLRYRDTLDIFENCRKIGDIGVPFMIDDEGVKTLDWRGWMKDHGYVTECDEECCCLLNEEE
ncbi:MAG: hypothetical protein IJG49_07450 [Erysipelotrichaceae bacterium]|nr:hypothetical protein [Erysipelotrichaceae bacterium]